MRGRVFRAALGALTAVVCLTADREAQALPKFAQRENRPCAYCHVKPTGGGKRNARGMWYEEHGFSFRGYTEEKTAPKSGPAPGAKPSVKPAPPARPAVKAAPKPAVKPIPKRPTPKKPTRKPR